MSRVSVDPAIQSASPNAAFVQTVLVSNKGKPVGRAVWTSSPTQPGTVQILCIEVPPTHARQGIGSQIVTRLIEQAQRRCAMVNMPLRRVWIVVEQKTHIVARGFLTRHGFHHMKTLDGLYKDEAAMVYVKSFD